MLEREGSFQVFIENPAGTNIKHTFNEKTLEPIRTDTVAAKYPFPYGFILQTTSGDGDNVDCFVITERELTTGAVGSVRGCWHANSN